MSDSTGELFSRLFSDSYEALRRYVRRLVPSKEAAEDIVQEAFLRTYEQGQRVETPQAFLFSAARNLAFNASRQRRSHKTDPLTDLETPSLASAADALEGGLLADEESRLLKEAIERLPPRCRAAFTLRVFHACSYKEIALRLGLSPRTVENHVARALRETHEYLRRRYEVE